MERESYREAKQRLEDVEAHIQSACRRAKRSRSDVTLIAVSKTKPVSMLEDMYALGIRDFGENKVQEMLEKQEKLPGDIRWHLIGHLQTNKVKYVIGKVTLIHSVDSIRLARVIEKESAKAGVITDILIEVNVSGEESKFGVSCSELLPLIQEISKMEHIRVKGLMTIPPNVENSEENRHIFAQLRKLSVDIAAQNIDNVSVAMLSMGMTNDYGTAIEEGADLIRVGTALFGSRSYR